MNDDKLMKAAGQLSTEISPERDLWPDIAAEIEKPARRRWTPMLAQAAAIVLLVGASSAVTYIATKDGSGPIVSVAPELVFEQAAFGGNYHLGPGFQDARNSLRDDLDVELARLVAASPHRHVAHREGHLFETIVAVVEIGAWLEHQCVVIWDFIEMPPAKTVLVHLEGA